MCIIDLGGWTPLIMSLLNKTWTSCSVYLYSVSNVVKLSGVGILRLC